MKKMNFLWVMLLMLMPLFGKSQIIIVSGGIPIVYTGSNQSGGELFCRMHSSTPPPFPAHGIEDYYYTYVNESHVFTGPYMTTMDFEYKKPGSGTWAGVSGPTVAAVNSMVIGGSLTFSNGCETFTVTKSYGYSVVGATYSYSLNVSVFEACP
jgi:hypothetical protein